MTEVGSWKAGYPCGGYFSIDINVINCNFFRTEFGVYFYQTVNGRIIDAYFEDIELNPIRASTTDNILVKGCVFRNVTDSGTWITASDNWTFIDNDFMHCYYGLYAQGSDDFNITMNYFHDNNEGIHSLNCDGWSIKNNTILWSYWNGIHLVTTTNTDVYYNIIAISGIRNGFDGNFRYWDDGIDTGNWWDDANPPAVYDIEGAGGSQDRYPMKFMVTEPIINNPIDIWIAEGSTGNVIVWWPYDDSLRDWEVEIDGEFWYGESWNFKNATVNIDGLPYGTHTVVITVWDVNLNSVTDTVLVHVYDATLPEIDGPPNQWLFVDATGQTIEWEVSDKNPDTYILYVDGEEFATGTWENGTLAINVDDIEEGEHTLLLTIFDIDGNYVEDVVLVLVINDDTDPTIEDADDVVYTVGTTGNEIVWDAEDEYPASYAISFNGSITAEGSWGGARIIFDVDGLAVGTYEYSITVYDMSGNSASSSANVTVLPVIPPEEAGEIDWILIIIIGAVVGGAIVLAVVIYYMRKKQ